MLSMETMDDAVIYARSRAVPRTTFAAVLRGVIAQGNGLGRLQQSIVSQLVECYLDALRPPGRLGRRGATHTATPSSMHLSLSIGICFPSSSFLGSILTAHRIMAANMNRKSSARCWPGQTRRPKPKTVRSRPFPLSADSCLSPPVSESVYLEGLKWSASSPHSSLSRPIAQVLATSSESLGMK